MIFLLWSSRYPDLSLCITKVWTSTSLSLGSQDISGQATTWPRPRLSRSLVAAVASDDALHCQPLSARETRKTMENSEWENGVDCT
jgi:hypothetical protein